MPPSLGSWYLFRPVRALDTLVPVRASGVSVSVHGPGSRLRLAGRAYLSNGYPLPLWRKAPARAALDGSLTVSPARRQIARRPPNRVGLAAAHRAARPQTGRKPAGRTDIRSASACQPTARNQKPTRPNPPEETPRNPDKRWVAQHQPVVDSEPGHRLSQTDTSGPSFSGTHGEPSVPTQQRPVIVRLSQPVAGFGVTSRIQVQPPLLNSGMSPGKAGSSHQE